MFAVVARSTIEDFDEARKFLREEGIPRLSQMPGFVSGHWVRLGETIHQHGMVSFRPELGVGDEADVNYMTSAVGLIWRSLIMWMLVIGLVTVAYYLGH